MHRRTRAVWTATWAIWVGGMGELAVALADDALGHCLRAVTVGENATPVTSCPDQDPLNLADNVDVRMAMTALGISPDRVHFKGCEKLDFAARPAANGANYSYVVTYPSEVNGAFLAPILHELAHVMQMEAAGGLTQLRVEYKQSRRIELGADYLAGLMFSKLFPQADLKAFEQNILLTGMYVESDESAHGTPSQRTSAFRFGVFADPEKIGNDMRAASQNFRKNIYGLIK